MKEKVVFRLFLALGLFPCVYGEWVGGRPIPFETAGGRGPLALGLVTSPVGTASVYGGARPDLFVATWHHSVRPGLFLMRFAGTADGDAPVFADPQPVAHPGPKPEPPSGYIFQTDDREIHGFWVVNGRIIRTRFNQDQMAFVAAASDLVINDLPGGLKHLTVMIRSDGSADLVLSAEHGGPFRPAGPGHRDADYFPYDGRGVWRGKWPAMMLYGAHLAALDAPEVSNVRKLSSTDREALMDMISLTPVQLETNEPPGVLTGSWFGNFLYYRNTETNGVRFEPQQLITDSRGITVRHPVIRPAPAAYPSLSRPGTTDLIVGCEGYMRYYRFSGKYAADGRPMFDAPQPVLMEHASLYPGSLPVLSVIDWNGDGLDDLISGNSEGKVLFFENSGTEKVPMFGNGVEVVANGEPVYAQQGYGGIQGPQESRWGYSCPTAVDWNGDGLPDLVLSSATQWHEVYLNIGSRQKPELDRARTIFCRGLDLHGTWRVQPAVARLGDRMAYVALDDDDQFHLYWRLDDFNVEDGGKLRLTDGSIIGANFLHAGGTGRLKLIFNDWDKDGKVDLIVGTPRHASVPNPEAGLPQSLGLPGAAVLFLKNAGDNSAPVFEPPCLMCFRDQPIYHGQHACGPAVWGDGDLLVGSQDGTVFYYPRGELTWCVPQK